MDHAVVEAAALANGDTKKYQSFEQQRSLAGAKLEKELKKRFFRWAPARSSIEELVGQLIPSWMAEIVKTKGGVMKTQLIHVLWKSGLNNLAVIPERIELTRLINAVLGVLDMVQRCNSGESVDIANLDFADTFKQPPSYNRPNRGTCQAVLTSREWKGRLLMTLSCSASLLAFECGNELQRC